VTLTEAASHFAHAFSKKPLSRLSRLFGRMAEIMADQTAVELGMLPEDLMINGGEHQPKNEKSSEESDTPEDLHD